MVWIVLGIFIILILIVDIIIKVTGTSAGNSNVKDSVKTTTTINQIYDVFLETNKYELEAKPGENVEYKIKVTND